MISSFAPSTATAAEPTADGAVSVVATVNGQTITSKELDHAIGSALAGSESAGARAVVQSQVLNDLINQKLLVQAFKKTAQGQDPNRDWQLDFVTQQAMAGLYLNSQLNRVPKLDEKMVNEFIVGHPEFTAKRKTYHYNQYIVDSKDPSTRSELEKLAAKSVSLDEIKNWLTQQKIPHMRYNLWRSSEQIDPVILKTLDRISNNVIDLQSTPDDKNIMILKRIDAYPDPVDVEDARLGYIRGYQAEARKIASEAIIAQLRSSAQIQIADANISSRIESAKAVQNLTPDAPRVSFYKYMAIAWYFALLVMVPIPMVLTYRKQKGHYMEVNRRAAKIDHAMPTVLPVHFAYIPVFIALACGFLLPVYLILDATPDWLNLRLLSKLCLAGLVAGAGVVLACIAVPWIRRKLARKPWFSLIALMIGQTIVMAIDFL